MHNKKTLLGTLFLIVGSVLLTGTLANSATLCVNSGGTDGCSSSIQGAINQASAGDTINIAAGTYSENITVNKRLSLIGAGSGNDPAANTIVTKSSGAVFLLATSGNSAADALLIKNMRVKPVHVKAFYINDAAVSYIKLDNVFVCGTNEHNDTEAENGIFISITGSVSNLEIINCAFDHVTYGWYFHKQGDWGPGGTYARNISVSNTSFSNNDAKGLYLEKLSDATFTNCTFNNNGLNTAFFNAAHNAGVDVNLKGQEVYSKITFKNCTVTGNALSALNGVGLTVKGRNDGATYSLHPAALSNLTITGGSYSGNKSGIAIGNNVTGIALHGADIFSNITNVGLVNYTDNNEAIDASCTWWGDASGPAGQGPGSGNSINGNVNYSPWLHYTGGNSYGECTAEVTTTTTIALTTTTTLPLLTTTTTLPLLTTTTTLPLLTTTTTIKPQRKLTVAKSGTGTVTGAGITCGSDCTELYDNATLVTLTAMPDNSSTFTGWTGCDNSSDTGTCHMTMTDNKTVTAIFTLNLSTTTTTLPLLTTTTTLPPLTTTTTIPTTTTTAAPAGVFKDDFNGDTKSDILLKNAAGSLYVLEGKADGVSYATTATRIYKESTPATYSVVGTGDFNGDQNVDILLKNAAGSLYVLFGKADGVSYAATPTRIYKESTPATYTVVGTGDFNNDTHCDILLQNAAGSLYVLYGKADGVAYATAPTRIYKETSPATYTVAGTGDFNGDGNCDILLQNAAGSLYVLFGKDDGVSYATTATRIYKESTPATYSVVGTGDFNGDGNTDVLLKNAAGSLYVLFGKDDGVSYATTATRIYKESVPATYSVVGTADYNGDGNTDVLLKNAAGSLYVLFGKDDGVAYATTATRIYKESSPATYSVVGY